MSNIFIAFTEVQNSNIKYISNFSSSQKNQYECRDKWHFSSTLEVCQWTFSKLFTLFSDFKDISKEVWYGLWIPSNLLLSYIQQSMVDLLFMTRWIYSKCSCYKSSWHYEYKMGRRAFPLKLILGNQTGISFTQKRVKGYLKMPI